jgi:hypothetical protein
MTDTFVVPWRPVVWKEEQAFVDVDPFEGAHWGTVGEESNETAWTAWDDIYDGEQLSILNRSKEYFAVLNADVKLQTGSWVSVEPDETLGIPPSVPIQNFSMEAGGLWRTPKHGFTPSINHQIHCLVSYSSARRRNAKRLTFGHRD